MPEPAYPSQQAEILERERVAWSAWWAHMAEIDPEATREDGWSLKDVVAHIAAWQRYSSGRLEALGRGEPDPGPPPTDDFNERARAASLERSWDEVRAEAEGAHGEFVSTIASVPDATLAAHDGLGAFVVTANGLEHYAEHLPDLFAVP